MHQIDTIDRTGVRDRPAVPTVLCTVPGRFSVIVPVFNCREHLRTCLDSLLIAVKKYGNAEVIVVDNGSTDGSYEILQTEYPGVTVLQYPDLTIAALRNRGAEAGSGEYLTFIDADCTISPQYFDEARATFVDSKVTATGSLVGVPESSTWVERTWYVINSHNGNGPVKYVNSGNLVVRRQAFLRVGGFDETLTTGEDVELGQRLRRQGLCLYENHRVHADHLRNSKTLGQFFRRHAWHGQGLMIPFSESWLNKPLVMTGCHLALATVGFAQLFDAHHSLAVRIVGLILALNFVPVVTFFYRSTSNRRLPFPLPGVVLYHFYYAAKVYALLRFASGKRQRTYHK